MEKDHKHLRLHTYLNIRTDVRRERWIRGLSRWTDGEGRREREAERQTEEERERERDTHTHTETDRERQMDGKIDT